MSDVRTKMSDACEAMPRRGMAKRGAAKAGSGRAAAADTETRLTDQDHQALRLWLRMLACTNVVEQAVRERLKAAFAITLPRFDLMAQLQRSPGGLSMGELSQRMMVTGGNVTGIVAALEAEGLIVRTADPRDKRVGRVRLTGVGRSSFDRMALAHEGWIVDFYDGLSKQEQATLNELLAKLKHHVSQQQRSQEHPGC